MAHDNIIQTDYSIIEFTDKFVYKKVYYMKFFFGNEQHNDNILNIHKMRDILLESYDLAKILNRISS